MLGQPDLIFTRKKAAVFVDGCFWHGCTKCHDYADDCNEFWQKKIKTNVARDRRVTRELRKAGWVVIRVWEHDLRTMVGLAKTAEKVAMRLRKE